MQDDWSIISQYQLKNIHVPIRISELNVIRKEPIKLILLSFRMANFLDSAPKIIGFLFLWLKNCNNTFLHTKFNSISENFIRELEFSIRLIDLHSFELHEFWNRKNPNCNFHFSASIPSLYLYLSIRQIEYKHNLKHWTKLNTKYITSTWMTMNETITKIKYFW